jgi:cytochrome c oxidase subunit 4
VNHAESPGEAGRHPEGTGGGHGGAVGHVVATGILAKVWIGLLVLTVVTVTVAGINLGPLNLLVAMGIATVKGSLVALYFMHLRWDKPFNAVVFIAALLFVALFVSLALLDTVHYQPTLIPDYAPALNR